MYSTLDKAIVSFVVAALGVIGIVWKPISISPETISAIVAVVTPILVYLWPNAPKDPAA